MQSKKQKTKKLNRKKEKTKTSKPEAFIPVNDVIYTLRVARQQFNILKDIGGFKIVNKNGKDCISQTDFKKLAYDNNVHKSAIDFFNFSLGKREVERLTKNGEFLSHNSKIISKYRGYIKTLENIHAMYHSQLNILHTESALVAAYLLYYKVINLLYMSCTCLENLYWHSTVLLRPIDEAIDLALYFVITEKTNKGKNDLKKWFRENEIISHRDCREAKAKHLQTFLKDEQYKIDHDRLTELYKKKSATLHPTHHEIIELYGAKIGNNWIMYQGIDYAACSYCGKILELTKFFQSSIWSAVQGFFICFSMNMPLRKEDRDTLSLLNKKFSEEVDNQ